MAWVMVAGAAAKVIGGGIGAGMGKKQKEEQVAEREENMRLQGRQEQQQEITMDNNYSQDVLSTYNPQGDSQMYARRGASLYYHGGVYDNMGMKAAHPFGAIGVPGYQGGGKLTAEQEEGGTFTPYPYQDQPRTMINPTTMYKNGGKTLLSMVQAGNPNAYWPKNNDNNLNNPAHVRTHRDNQDPRYYGSSQNQSNYKSGGTLLERVQSGNTNSYWPTHSDNNLNNPAHVRTHRDNMDPRYYGSSQNQNNFQGGGIMPGGSEGLQAQAAIDAQRIINPVPQQPQPGMQPGMQYGGAGYNDEPDVVPGAPIMQAPEDPTLFQNGGNMFQQLQDTGMQEYQAFQNGGAAQQVPGGQLEDVGAGVQEVKGDNPGAVDAVKLGTNPGEPDASVDNNELIRDAKDENGEPYKQIFSDTVMMPGTSKSMAKAAKKELNKMPKDPEKNPEQAAKVEKELDSIFETQQMLNGDSHGENPEEAAAGGMDPAAAAAMPPEGQGAFGVGGYGQPGSPFSMADMEEMQKMGAAQEAEAKRQELGMQMGGRGPINERTGDLYQMRQSMMQMGGAGYPSAGYDAALREQQMQVPYPSQNKEKEYQAGGKSKTSGGDILSSALGGLSGSVGAGYGLGYSLTDDYYGEKNVAGAIGSGSQLLQGMPQNIANHTSQKNNAQIQQDVDSANAQMEKDKQEAEMAKATASVNGEPGGVGMTMNYQPEMYGSQGTSGGLAQNGAAMYQNGGQMYQDGGVMVVMIEAQPLETTLADLQNYSKPDNWGHLDDQKDTLRQTSLNMGRMHRGPALDATPVISGSERGGPIPKKKVLKSFRNGGRLYYGHSLYNRSLTLSIL